MTNVGVIGCGNISEIYLQNLQSTFAETDVVAVFDLDISRARLRAQQYGIRTVAASVDELVAMPEVEIVVNLTVPSQHYLVSDKALRAGKHVYSEKPMAGSVDEGEALVRLASHLGLLYMVAPDTVLGDAIQTARRAIDSGLIGTPFGFVGQTLTAGPARWHPDPEFLYQKGAGPIMDYAPYSVSELVYLFGPVARVASFGSRPFASLEIAQGRRAGQRFDVSVDTFEASGLQFESGVVGSLVHSMSVPRTALGQPNGHGQSTEVYGTQGSLILPAAGSHSGAVRYAALSGDDWVELNEHVDRVADARGLGVVDLARAIAEGRPPSISAAFCLHVFDVLSALAHASEVGEAVSIVSRSENSRDPAASLPSDMDSSAHDHDFVPE